MNIFIKIQIGFALLGIAEAWLEAIVISLKNPNLINYDYLNRQEHRRSAVYWMAIIAAFVFVADTWLQVIYLVPALACNRRIFFEYALKCFRPGKRIRFIEGAMFWDKISRQLFGLRGGYWELQVCVAGIISINKFLLV